MKDQHTIKEPLQWTPFRKSSFCDSGDCIEVSLSENGDAVIRDGKLRASLRLAFTPDEWRAFVAGVRAGEFEAPSPAN